MTVLIAGGASCGKSACAERLCLSLPGPRYYIAAMRPDGRDAAERIARHRRLRAGKGFETVERYEDLAGLILPRRGTALLECVGTLTANEMFPEDGSVRDPFGPVLEGIAALERQCSGLILVTNDVGSGGADYGEGTRQYMAALGRINAALAVRADRVWELVCGIPLAVKGGLTL